MFGLGPGIGAEEVKARDTTLGQKPLEGVLAFEPQHLSIGESKIVDFFANTPDAPEETLDSEEIAFRIVLRHLDEEGAIATTEVDFHGVVVVENLVRLVSTEKIFGHEFAEFWSAGAGWHARSLKFDV